MKAGDKIRVFTYCMGHETGTVDHTIEEFRFCLGFFQSKDHRKASEFTPLCVLYERGPDSENDLAKYFDVSIEWLNGNEGFEVFSKTEEELYQRFKKRLMNEIVVSAPDLSTLAILVDVNDERYVMQTK